MGENQVADILFRIVAPILNPGDRAQFRASLLANTGRYRVRISRVDGPSGDPPQITEEDMRAFIALRSSMATAQGGTWFNATFEIQADGTYRATFDYDNPPDVIIAESVEKEMYIEDLAEFPRPPEAIPAWLRSILTALIPSGTTSRRSGTDSFAVTRDGLGASKPIVRGTTGFQWQAVMRGHAPRWPRKPK